ncbi:MAG: sterol desaturase family protein [Chitinophagaceae bacterium]
MSHLNILIQPLSVGILFAGVYVVENLLPERKVLTRRKHDLHNLLIGAGNMVVVLAGGYVLQALLIRMNHQGFGLLYFLPYSWMGLVLGIILSDLWMYWWHRANHIFPFFWQFHRFHHLDTQINSTSSLRFHIGEISFSYLFKIPVFVLLGISPTAVLIYGLILFPVVVFQHSNIRIAQKVDLWLRILIVSPWMHRIHHSKIRQETDSNYSSVFPYWDRIFHTYRKHPQGPIEFGL